MQAKPYDQLHMESGASQQHVNKFFAAARGQASAPSRTPASQDLDLTQDGGHEDKKVGSSEGAAKRRTTPRPGILMVPRDSLEDNQEFSSNSMAR